MIKELQEKALLGDGLCAYILGRSYYSAENNVEQDYLKSFSWYKFGHDRLKDPRCIYGYAMFFYDDGESESEGIVEKNNIYANQLFKQAYPKLVSLSNLGDAYSTFILGAYYNYGIGGVEKSFDNALVFIKRAAQQGHAGAMYDLGKFYETGRGVQKDLEKSRQYYTMAAQLGNVRAKLKTSQLDV